MTTTTPRLGRDGSPLPPTVYITVHWTPGTADPVVVYADGIALPFDVVGVLKTAAMQMCSRHGIDGRAALAAFLAAEPAISGVSEDDQ